MKLLLKHMCEKEGKKSQVKRADMQETLKILATVIAKARVNVTRENRRLRRDWTLYVDSITAKMRAKKK